MSFENENLRSLSCPQCRKLMEVISNAETHLAQIETRLAALSATDGGIEPKREYYGVAEFSKIVSKSEYTVREWCRLCRINAEKCESGYGDSKSWKIPASELARYKNHGLLPSPTRY